MTNYRHDVKPDCTHCWDTGWLELKGVDDAGYERGATACRYCQPGQKHLRADPSLTQHYNPSDIETPQWQPPGPYPPKELTHVRAAPRTPSNPTETTETPHP